MALIVTPGQFTQRADFYHQLNQLTAAGVDIVRALQQIGHHPPSFSYRAPIQRTLERLAAGNTLAEALTHGGRWLPEFDLTLIEAGEKSGRLDACFQLLGDYYADRARITRQILADLAYPLFLFHFAVFIFPFSQFFASGNLRVYLEQTLGVLLPVYAVVAALIYAAQSKHGETWRGGVEAALRPVPMLGAARHCLALGRLAAALEALVNAGVTIIEAWELAASASGSPALRRAVLSWRPLLLAGQTPAEVVRASGHFPEMFAHQYATGEMSGKLDETLRRLHRYYQDEGSRKIHAVSVWVPRIIYLGIVLGIAFKIVSFYTGYFKMVRDAGGF